MYFKELISGHPSYSQPIDFEVIKSNPPIIQKTTNFTPFDIIVRVASTSTSSLNINIDLTQTETFRSSIKKICAKFENDIKILAYVVKSQRKLIEYNAIYNAYLIGQISEEEFIKESENYVYSPQSINIKILLNKLECLFKYTGSDFSSSELAEIFQCKQENIEETLKQLPKIKFAPTII